MSRIRNPDFSHTYRHLLPHICEICPRTRQVIVRNAAILNAPGKDAELLSPLVWLIESNDEYILSEIERVVELDLIYSTLLTHTVEDAELAKAIFNIASMLRTSDNLTMENLARIIQFPAINDTKYHPAQCNEQDIKKFDVCAYIHDLSNYISSTGHSQLINCSEIASFVQQNELLNHHNFTNMLTFIVKNSAILNDIKQLLENTAGTSEEDYLKILLKIDFINTRKLQFIKRILSTLKNYGELSSEKIDFLFSSIQEKINSNQTQEIQPFLENTVINILNLTFFEMSAAARLQLLSNLDVLDELFSMGLTLSELLLFDTDMRQILLDNITEDNIEIIRFFINWKPLSAFLFFSSYVNKEILKQLNQITIELKILGEFNNDRLEQLFQKIFNSGTTLSDIKKFFGDQLSAQFDSITIYDFFDLPESIISQLLTNNESMELIWQTGISLAEFTSLDDKLRDDAILDITQKNAMIVKFFGEQGMPAKLFFGSETLSIIDDIAVILMRDNAGEISFEQLAELYSKFQEYHLVLQRRYTMQTTQDFFQMQLELLEDPEKTISTTARSVDHISFFSSTGSSRNSDSDSDADCPPPSP